MKSEDEDEFKKHFEVPDFDELLQENPEMAKHIAQEKAWFDQVQKEYVLYQFGHPNNLAELIFGTAPGFNNRNWSSEVIDILNPVRASSFLKKLAGSDPEYQKKAQGMIKQVNKQDRS